MRPTLLAAALAVVAAVAMTPQAPAAAQEFPTRPIRFVQGFGPGGNMDIIARLLADDMSRTLGQPVVAESRPGAGGNLATEQIVRGQPDGYTLLLITTSHVILPALKRLSYDPIEDLDYISVVSQFPFYVVVDAKSQLTTLKALLETARARTDGLTYGTAGTGSGQHMAGEQLALTFKSRLVHVPFRGSSEAVTALLSRNIDFVIAPLTDLKSNIEAGVFRPLAVTSAKRWPLMPDVPTVAESMLPGFDVMAFVGVATTKGIPRSVLDRLNTAVRSAIAAPAVAARLNDLGMVPAPGSSGEMKGWIATQVKHWKDVVAAAGIKVD